MNHGASRIPDPPFSEYVMILPSSNVQSFWCFGWPASSSIVHLPFNSGIVTFEIGDGLVDSAGNPIAAAWRLPLLK